MLIVRKTDSDLMVIMPNADERPLTAKGLNAFYRTAHTELHRSGLNQDTKEASLRDLAEFTLPVEPHQEMQYVVAADEESGRRLPETLSELRAHIEHITNSYVESEMSPEVAKLQLLQVYEKAYRAAEREMSQGTNRSR